MSRDAFIQGTIDDTKRFNKDIGQAKTAAYIIGTVCLALGYFVSIDAVIALLMFLVVMTAFAIERRLQHLQQQIDRISVHKA